MCVDDVYRSFVLAFLHQMLNILLVDAFVVFRLGLVSLAITDILLDLAKFQVRFGAFNNRSFEAQKGLASGMCLPVRGELAHIIKAFCCRILSDAPTHVPFSPFTCRRL